MILHAKRTAAAALTCAVLWPAQALAQESPLEWYVQVAGGGQPTTLVLGVPETDDRQLVATCASGARGPAEMTIGLASVDGRSNREPIELRFSGSGQEHQLPAQIEIPESSEAIVGAKLDIPTDHPVWTIMGQGEVTYQIPGYVGARISQYPDTSAIQTFLDDCRSGGTTTVAGGGNPTGGMTAREAFDAARDLDTPGGWRAFLAAYPDGFLAELARGYLEKLNGGNDVAGGGGDDSDTPPPPPPPPPPPRELAYSNLGAGQTPWFPTRYQQPGRSDVQAAAVRANGLEMFAWCNRGDNAMNFGWRETSPGSYPSFHERMLQGMRRDRVAQVAIGSNSQRFAVSYSEELGQAFFSEGMPANSASLEGIMSSNRITVDVPPFGATFQLSGSRRSLCSVALGCGMRVPGCVSRGLAGNPIRRPETNNDTRCRARSIFIEGRGCVLRRFVDGGGGNRNGGGRGSNAGDASSSNGCPPGRVRFDSKCLRPSDLASYCGGGFRPVDGSCEPIGGGLSVIDARTGDRITDAQCVDSGRINAGKYCIDN